MFSSAVELTLKCEQDGARGSAQVLASFLIRHHYSLTHLRPSVWQVYSHFKSSSERRSHCLESIAGLMEIVK